MTINSDLGQRVLSTLTNWGFWSAIVATFTVILLGFLLTKKNILKKEWDKVFIKLVMVVGLPALALQGFLDDISIGKLQSESLVLLIGFIFYTLMMFTSRFFYIKYERNVQDTLAMCTALASTTFFGIPIVTQLFDGASITANLFNVPYRIFLYSLAFMIMSSKPQNKELTNALDKKAMWKQNLKNIFLNPILICTFIGLIIWATQLIPGIKVVKISNINDGEAFSPLRVDLLFPPIAKILTIVSAICTPLAWTAIGIQLAKGNFKEAIKSKKVWYGSFMKVVTSPLIILGIASGVAGIFYAVNGNTPLLTTTALGVLVIMTATPPATVVVSYAIAYDKEPKLAADLTLVTTLLSIITLPLWVLVITAMGALPIFGG